MGVNVMMHKSHIACAYCSILGESVHCVSEKSSINDY